MKTEKMRDNLLRFKPFLKALHGNYFEFLVRQLTDKTSVHKCPPEILNNIRPILFSEPPDIEDVQDHLDNKDIFLDMPFQTITLESVDRNPLFHLEYLDEDAHEEGETYFDGGMIFCVLIHEEAPKVFTVYTLEVRVSGDEIVMMGVQKYDNDDPQYYTIMNVLSRLLDMKTSGVWGSEKFKRKIKTGKGSYLKIKNLIHVKPSKSSSNSLLDSKNIDWSHRWEVRGHWRKCATIGKDREGKYGVKGFTWVAAHSKGPEDAPLIKKTRIIHA